MGFFSGGNIFAKATRSVGSWFGIDKRQWPGDLGPHQSPSALTQFDTEASAYAARKKQRRAVYNAYNRQDTIKSPALNDQFTGQQKSLLGS